MKKLTIKNFSFQVIIFFLSTLALVLYLGFYCLKSSLLNAPLYVIIVLGGIPLILQILYKLLKGNLGADFLAVLALVVAIYTGEYLAAVLIILMLSGGQVLEQYAMKKASSVLYALSERMPSFAHKKFNDEIADIPLSSVQRGDLIVIYPHETVVVDGEVIDGHSTMDESYLTGEPYHVSKAPGTKVISGSVNGESVLIIRAEKLPSDSRYANIMKVMQDAEQKKPSMRRIGDKIGSIFAPIALIFAVSSWIITGDITRFLSVLVIATPCPLLIAIPITLISAISMSAKRGIIIKDPTVLELLPTCRTAIFDKTGTLTYGKPELVEIITAPNIDKNKILQLVASIERYSKHPLAVSVIQKANSLGINFIESQSVTENPGEGLVGSIENSKIIVTDRKHLKKINPSLISELPPTAIGLECVVLQDDNYAATFQFRDAPRTDGKSFISHLKPSHNFEKVMLVSGDRESEVNYLAKLLEINDVFASQSPEQKLEIVKEETKKSPTLFMGDGINDAPALAVATVGIAFGHGSNVTSEAAGAVIMDSLLSKVDELMHISHSMRIIALQSAIGGMVFSIVGMIFASMGFISPVMGALLQEVIDVFAILNALRLTITNKVETDLI